MVGRKVNAISQNKTKIDLLKRIKMIPEVVDTYATGNSETEPPIDIGYSGHTYSRVVPTSATSN